MHDVDDAMEDSNRSSNPSIHEVSDPARRVWIHRMGMGAVAAALAAWGSGGAGANAATRAGLSAGSGTRPGSLLLGFQGIEPSDADAVRVPPGYTAQVLVPWGDPVGLAGALPAFRRDGSNTAEEQAAQLGMHHDGLDYFPLDDGQGGSTRGLLAINHEYTDEALLHPEGLGEASAEKVRKSQNAHGISVVEVALREGRWEAVQPSPYARRITASTPFRVAGPAAGHPMMCTAADPQGVWVLGTMNNCASGRTPWGTFLSGEENFAGYFRGRPQPTAHEARWGLNHRQGWTRWAEHDVRFDVNLHPNEPNRFGWVVEVDPMDPGSMPVKRTALGRAAHEGVWATRTQDGRAVVYSGEDAQFEYIYKFVSRDRIRPAQQGLSAAQANRDLLDHGTLYVARFDADGTGRWLPVVHGQGPLTAAQGFADQGQVLIQARQASDLLGATKMDRPEWLAIDESSRWVYCSLTNNSARGAAGRPGADAANPRERNTMGQIIRWQEAGDFDGETFVWNHLMLAGHAGTKDLAMRGTIQGDAFACPDGLSFDARGVLWIRTDVGSSSLNRGDHAALGNNQLLACDVHTGEVRRFLTGPRQCEIAGLTWTPDGRTMFVNIQHPGEGRDAGNDPRQPRRLSNWPDFQPDGRPRSATVVVRRVDGGVIGAG